MAIIAISDVHLGYMINEKELADTKKFIDFLGHLAKGDLVDKDHVTDFVICGDFLDMWRRDMAGVVIENLHILKMIQHLQPRKNPKGPEINVHYLAGNHDYHIGHLKKYYYPFDFKKGIDPTKGFELPDKESGKTYWFKHGYDCEPLMLEAKRRHVFDLLSCTSDEIGDFQSLLWNIFSKIEAFGKFDIKAILGCIADGDAIKIIESLFQLSNSLVSPEQKEPIKKLRKNILKSFDERILLKGNRFKMSDYLKYLKENEPLVFGHTHKPFHYEKGNKKAINLGSWIKDDSSQGERIHNTYLEIKDGQERLLVYLGENKKEEIPKTNVIPD